MTFPLWVCIFGFVLVGYSEDRQKAIELLPHPYFLEFLNLIFLPLEVFLFFQCLLRLLGFILTIIKSNLALEFLVKFLDGGGIIGIVDGVDGDEYIFFDEWEFQTALLIIFLVEFVSVELVPDTPSVILH